MNILYIIAAIVILGVIVMVHEFGHYLVGRLTGMGILEFSVGFGPKLIGFRRKDIDYSLRAIPLGGYCKFLGEDEKNDDPRAMRNQKAWKRILTVAAGPVMNFILAYVCAFLLIWGYGSVMSAPVVAAVGEATPAYEAGLQVGDIVREVKGQEISFDADGTSKMISLIGSGEEAADIVIERDGELLNVTIVPEYIEEAQTYRVGVSLGYTSIRYSFAQSIGLTGQYVSYIFNVMIDSLKNLVTTGEGLNDTMGPVGIISFVSQEVQQGFDMVLYLMIIISLNLGIMNLIPFPGLDGARLLFLFVEVIIRRPINPDKEGLVHAIGLLLLLGLIMFISYRDIVRIFTGG